MTAAWIKTRTAALTVLLLALLPAGGAGAENQLDRQQAESGLAEVTAEISLLKRQLEESRADHAREQAGLREVDLAIQRADLEFRSLERQRREHLAEMEALERRRAEYLGSLQQQQEQLADQVRASYRMGSPSRMKLILNQDDPARLGRMIAYYDYFNRAQAGNIALMRESLTTLGLMQQSISRELSGLNTVQMEQREVLDELQLQRAERGELLAGLSSQIGTSQARLSELERNRRDLETLIERLADALADIPADLGSRMGIAGRKGHLPLPVKGPVRHAFGERRAGGLNWRGWLIGADAGAEVAAVAHGRVAFADWLRGYGLMIIVDHGQGYLSLYGQNESLLREVGAWVRPGEVISIVGGNPGSGQGQGLYFELRKNGKAVDPAAWLAR